MGGLTPEALCALATETFRLCSKEDSRLCRLKRGHRTYQLNPPLRRLALSSPFSVSLKFPNRHSAVSLFQAATVFTVVPAIECPWVTVRGNFPALKWLALLD